MSTTPLHRHHERRFEGNRFVYPVISRRSRGVSIGVNLNPDKVCNFDCVYCQVDRTVAGDTRFVELERLLTELDETLALAVSGRLFETDKFRSVPPELRRLNDIAFSGDGEPTTHRNFDEIITACAEVKRRHGLDDVKMVLITNAQQAPSAARAARSGDLGPQPGRDLGQARCGHGGVFSLGQPLAHSSLACWRTSPRPLASGRWSSSRCGCGSAVSRLRTGKSRLFASGCVK